MGGLQHDAATSTWQFCTGSTVQTAGLGLVATVGTLVLASKTLSFIRALLSIFVLPGKSLRSFGPKGSWALITGASDGIGKEYALQIARQGFNLLLVSRTTSKLHALANEITAANSAVRVETVAMDFSKNDPQDYTRLTAALRGKDVSILINNVGQSHSIPVPFAETPAEERDAIITINCTGTLKVTQLVLPGMVERKRGLILTMGSFGGVFPTPLLATYSGSKAFLQQWSTALAGEVAQYGVTVHFVHSYLVTSAMSKVRRASALIPSPRSFVQTTLSKIGRTGGSQGYAYSGSPWWSHALMLYGAKNLTSLFGRLALKLNYDMHLGIRKAALRKAERERQKAEASKSA
ncbi:putative 3-ketoacyl-reductase [Phaeomoniella chlamydospora]|uniref:Very-long-chain 3-oxoacyl-CoA reductase n=1 Tax=Phaeomoniella chlamydospora TaxID=158046 RepID=A0A0G2EP70_PHACM|nr:putative 3-ketoacyl-reductase [Phaeomoniella chlamydospora]